MITNDTVLQRRINEYRPLLKKGFVLLVTRADGTFTVVRSDKGELIIEHNQKTTPADYGSAVLVV